MWPKVENTFYTQTEREIPTARDRGREREREGRDNKRWEATIYAWSPPAAAATLCGICIEL